MKNRRPRPSVRLALVPSHCRNQRGNSAQSDAGGNGLDQCFPSQVAQLLSEHELAALATDSQGAVARGKAQGETSNHPGRTSADPERREQSRMERPLLIHRCIKYFTHHAANRLNVFPAISQAGSVAWRLSWEATFSSVRSCCWIEGGLAAGLHQTTVPLQSQNSLFASANCQRTTSRKHCPPS
jgi:hypothetical protein